MQLCAVQNGASNCCQWRLVEPPGGSDQLSTVAVPNSTCNNSMSVRMLQLLWVPPLVIPARVAAGAHANCLRYAMLLL